MSPLQLTTYHIHQLSSRSAVWFDMFTCCDSSAMRYVLRSVGGRFTPALTLSFIFISLSLHHLIISSIARRTQNVFATIMMLYNFHTRSPGPVHVYDAMSMILHRFYPSSTCAACQSYLIGGPGVVTSLQFLALVRNQIGLDLVPQLYPSSDRVGLPNIQLSLDVLALQSLSRCNLWVFWRIDQSCPIGLVVRFSTNSSY